MRLSESHGRETPTPLLKVSKYDEVSTFGTRAAVIIRLTAVVAPGDTAGLESEDEYDTSG